MSDEMSVKISDIKSKAIREAARLADAFGGKTDGCIDKEEGAKLARFLSGEMSSKKLQKKIAKESDEVKAIFGLNVSKPIETTEVAAKAVNTDSKAEELKTAFRNKMGYNSETNQSNGTTTKEAYEAIKKEYKGKEYKKARQELEDYAKHDFVNERAQKTRTQVQAYDGNYELINEDNLQYNTSKKVLKREKELTTANNNGVRDKWAEKALRNKNVSFGKKVVRLISGNDSEGKKDDKGVAAGNNAARIREKESFTKEQLVKALGKDSPLLKEYTDKNGNKYENILVAADLITKDGNQYRVKKLSKVVGSSIGTDNTLNDHDEHNPSEIQSVLSNLWNEMDDKKHGDFNTYELKDSQVRDLVDFLGYGDDRAKLMAVRFWQNIWKEAGKGAVAGAAGGAANTSIIKMNAHSKQEVNINLAELTAEQRENLLKGLQSEAVLSDVPVMVNSGNGFEHSTISNISETATGIRILQESLTNVKITRILKAIAAGALTGAGAGAAIGALETIGSHAREREVLGMVFDCDTTYDKIVGKIGHAYSDKNLSPAMKEALKTIAELGIVKEKDPKTGVWKAKLDEDCNVIWDYCQFVEQYNKIRGNQILNAVEARAAARTVESEHIEVPECDPVCEHEDCPDVFGNKETKIPPHAWDRKGGEKWEAIVTAKYPCLVEELAKKGINMYSKDGAIKVMQRALATDENGKFHADEYRRIISGDIPKHIDFPDEISITIDGKTITCKYENNEVKRVSQKLLNAGKLKSNNGRFGYGRKGNSLTYTNPCYPGIQGEGKDRESAVVDFNKKLAAAQAAAQAKAKANN